MMSSVAAQVSARFGTSAVPYLREDGVRCLYALPDR